MKLTDLIDTIKAPNEKFESKSPEKKLITSVSELPKDPLTRRFELEVFNFLFANKNKLGIANVYQLKNQRADGIIETESSEWIPMEIKYVMNWDNACRCDCQFEQYFKISKDKYKNCSRGIVIFNQFSGDWKRHHSKSSLETGWHHWYSEQATLFSRPSFKLFLLQFDGKSLKSFTE